MILVRAPLRISFMGGGTDMPDFYTKYTGRVISTAIDKYVYLAIMPTPLVDKVAAKYSVSEMVDHPKDLKHLRIKAALVDLGINKNIEISSFASLPAKTGLGSSSSFSAALMKGLYHYKGEKIDRIKAAEEACRLEIDLIKEPIGKQDQYASALGGFNVLQFNANHSVGIKPLLLDYKRTSELEKNILLFFTGITRPASSILKEQKLNINKKLESLKKISDMVPLFEEALIKGDFEQMGSMLHESWLEKKKLASKISNSLIDQLYNKGLDSGAWGGKVLGAGGGGCIMFFAPPIKHEKIRKAMKRKAKEGLLSDFKEIPVKFVQSGVEVLFDGRDKPTSL